MSYIIDETLAICEVNGADMEAYAWDRDKPMSACFSAPQSLAPSPHIATVLPIDWYKAIILVLSFGLARAYAFTKFKKTRHSFLFGSKWLSNKWLNALPVKQTWTGFF